MSKPCPYCNGNNKDAPCAFPGEQKDGCLKLEEAFNDLGNLLKKFKKNTGLKMVVYVHSDGSIRNKDGWMIGQLKNNYSLEDLQNIEKAVSADSIAKKKESEPFHKVPDELEILNQYGHRPNDWDND